MGNTLLTFEEIARESDSTMTETKHATTAVDAGDIKLGDKITVEGIDKGLRGQMLVDGINPLTGRRCRIVEPMVMRLRPGVTYKVSGGQS